MVLEKLWCEWIEHDLLVHSTEDALDDGYWAIIHLLEFLLQRLGPVDDNESCESVAKIGEIAPQIGYKYCKNQHII